MFSSARRAVSCALSQSRRLQSQALPILKRNRPRAASSPAAAHVPVSAVLCDLDGTLLGPGKSVSPANLKAIREARARGVLFIPASGRSRPGIHNVLGALGEELLEVGTPSVTINGAAVYGPGGRGRTAERRTSPTEALKSWHNLPTGLRYFGTNSVDKRGQSASSSRYAKSANGALGLDFGPLISQSLLTPQLAAAVVHFWRSHPLAKAAGVSLLGSCGDRIVCEQIDDRLGGMSDWREPAPEEVGPLDEAALAGMPINRLFFMADASEGVDPLREELETIVQGESSLTRGSPDMIEVLPFGASKGRGVATLLSALGIPPSQVVAIGDEINDIEMLQLVGRGVAMGQACDQVKAAADYVAPSNEEDGVAAVLKHFGLAA